MNQNALEGVKCFILDMDGTVYLGDRLIDGADKFLKKLEEKGIDFRFFTNNSSHNAKSCADKLERLGLSYPESKIIISSHVTIDFLLKQRRGKSVYLLGNDNLKGDFEQSGITLSLDREQADILVLGFDTTLTYKKIQDAAYMLANGSEYIATHPDVNCPTDYGYMPDTGAMMALLKASTGRLPDMIMGKPHSHTVDYVCAVTGFKPSELAFAGDRMETDIGIGKAGVRTVLVYSGVTAKGGENGFGFSPDVTADKLESLIPLI